MAGRRAALISWPRPSGAPAILTNGLLNMVPNLGAGIVNGSSSLAWEAMYWRSRTRAAQFSHDFQMLVAAEIGVRLEQLGKGVLNSVQVMVLSMRGSRSRDLLLPLTCPQQVAQFHPGFVDCDLLFPMLQSSISAISLCS